MYISGGYKKLPAMPILIDGYNLLRGAAKWGPDKSLGQLRLCELLGRWSVLTKKPVTIVFDGPEPRAGYARQLRNCGIQVLYSGPGRSADDLLIEEIQRCSAPRRLEVVSADREIRVAARRRRCREIGPEVFFESVCSRLAASSVRPPRRVEPATKQKGLREGELHFWLAEFGLHGDHDGEDMNHPSRP